MNRPAGELGRRESRRTRRLVVAGAGVILALASAPAVVGGAARADSSACDWPMFQQNAARTASAPCGGISQTTVSTLHPAWFFADQNGGAVTATPTVSGSTVYVGDSSGYFYALDSATGAPKAGWTDFNVAANSCHSDAHSASYGEITSSAAVAADGTGRTLVVFGGGGTLYALDASSGACAWAQDFDPANPTSPMEIEASPAIVSLKGSSDPVVIAGSDVNEDSTPGLTQPGVQALDLRTGALLWKFDPQTKHTFTGPSWPTAAQQGPNNGCGDVWSSPAVDPAALNGDGLVAFGQGNCPTGSSGPAPSQVDGIMAIDATTGAMVWDFSEPPNAYSGTQYPDNGDVDFGSSAIISNGSVIEGGKSGYVYAVDETKGSIETSVQASQPGSLGVGPGAIGGFIGSAALGSANPPTAASSPMTFFGASAIPSPFDGNGLPALPGSIDTTMACGLDQGSVPDSNCLTRSASLHAVNALTGQVLWQAPVSLPTYGAVTYSNGVVFAPSTTGFSIHAYDADTGTQLWSFPLGATVASGAAVAGSSIFVGTGISEGATVPGANGVWAFTTTP